MTQNSPPSFAPPCVPANEEERLAALDRYRILDTPAEQEFDRITELIAQICQVPIAVVNFIDADRQFFKSEVGLGVRETPLQTSFCGHAILEEDLMIIPDATRDPRFQGNPLVCGEPHLRFYAGALLRTPDNHPIGTLCVLDYEPHDLDAEQVAALQVLAKHAMTLLELRYNNAQLEEALQFQKQLLRVVSHDLRTPLSVIGMSASALAEGRLSEEDVQSTAHRLQNATNTMRALVDDLLDHDALGRSAVSFNIESTPVSKLLDTLRETIEPLTRDKSLACSVQAEPDLPAVLCDPARFGQIMGNLAGNAVKFSAPGGAIRIQASAHAEGVCFSVEDSGPGIAAEDAGRIFQPFWRASGEAEGVGLGLSIVQRLVEGQNGSIALDPAYRDGARFEFVLPAAQ